MNKWWGLGELCPFFTKPETHFETLFFISYHSNLIASDWKTLPTNYPIFVLFASVRSPARRNQGIRSSHFGQIPRGGRYRLGWLGRWGQICGYGPGVFDLSVGKTRWLVGKLFSGNHGARLWQGYFFARYQSRGGRRTSPDRGECWDKGILYGSYGLLHRLIGSIFYSLVIIWLSLTSAVAFERGLLLEMIRLLVSSLGDFPPSVIISIQRVDYCWILQVGRHTLDRSFQDVVAVRYA